MANKGSTTSTSGILLDTSTSPISHDQITEIQMTFLEFPIFQLKISSPVLHSRPSPPVD